MAQHEPAFPQLVNTSYATLKEDGTLARDKEFKGGMSLRDWFAGMALQGMLNNGYNNDPEHEFLEADEFWHERVTRWAYQYADAMLKERDNAD